MALFLATLVLMALNRHLNTCEDTRVNGGREQPRAARRDGSAHLPLFVVMVFVLRRRAGASRGVAECATGVFCRAQLLLLLKVKDET